jgi:hypothetical protein
MADRLKLVKSVAMASAAFTRVVAVTSQLPPAVPPLPASGVPVVGQLGPGPAANPGDTMPTMLRAPATMTVLMPASTVALSCMCGFPLETSLCDAAHKLLLASDGMRPVRENQHCDTLACGSAVPFLCRDKSAGDPLLGR